MRHSPPRLPIGALAAALAAVAVLGPTARSAPIPGYRLETVWPASAHGLATPNNLSVDAGGRLWLLDGPSGAAVALARDGTLAETRPVPRDSLDLAAEPGGDLYLGRWAGTPRLHSTVGRYTASGAAAWEQQSPGATGTGVAATAGRVWFTEPKTGALVWFGRTDGRVSGQVAPRGVGRGFPADVAVGPDGTLFATDLVAGTVYAWPEPYLPGDYGVWSMLESSGPFRIGVGADAGDETLVAVLFSDGLVRVHRPDGTLVARFFVPGEPLDLAVGNGGRIYVLDEATDGVQVYAPGPPPTPTPVPADPPLTDRSCRLTGVRTLAPDRLTRCAATDVTLSVQADCPPGAVVGADIAIITDVSSSMRNGKLDGARAAARRFVDGLDLRYHQAAVIGFSGAATVEQPLSADRATLHGALDALTIGGGNTNIYAALRTASDHLRTAGRPDALPVMVLLTDGDPIRPMVPEPATAALVAAERARARRTYIVTIGLGNTIDSLLLETIASSRKDFYYAPDVVDLDRIYRAILDVVAQMNLTDLVVEDTPAEPFTRYVAGSGRPPPLVVNDTLTWTWPSLPADGLTFTYKLAAGAPGQGPAGRARVRYTDADGTRRTFTFPEPPLAVVLPTPTPGSAPPTAAPTDDPGLPTPLPATPVPVACAPGKAWWLQVVVFPDTVGSGSYRCPGCNGTWDGGDHWQLVDGRVPASTLIVADAAGSPLWIGDVSAGATRGPARANIQLCAPPPYRVTLARPPAGYVACPNSPPYRLIRPSAFAGGRWAETAFAVWPGCGIAPPTVPPARPPTATPTPLPPCP